MKVITENGERRDTLDQLADQAAQMQSGAPGPDQVNQEQAAAEAQAAQAFERMKAGGQRMLLGLLRAIRARLARKLPEIVKHWPDDNLNDVAGASIPVIEKRLALLLPMLANYPEEGALVMAAFPLLLGYMAAVQEHDSTVTDATDKTAQPDTAGA